MVGLHRRVMAGIDFKRLSNGDVLATCIVSSGYYDDKDVGKGGSDDDVLIYCGEGGDPKNPCGNKVAADQKLRGANLALKRSMERKLPVRVVRGFRTSSQERVISTYTYDGLYLVEKHWEVRGDNGYRVFKFQLRRIPGQPALSEVKRSRLEQAPLQYRCVDPDVSGGMERHPIRAMNAVNDTRPIGFSYISRLRYPSWYDPRPPAGCGCISGCAESSACACAAKNGGSFAYGVDGMLLETRPLVYECGPSCGCPRSCRNRVSQSGVKVQLQVFNAGSRGWGVRSPNRIAAGAFVCEYVGEVITEREAGKRSNDEYLFDVGRNYGGGEACEEDSCFTIDAAEYGNVGRFINHSCSPNLYAQNVLFDHDDRRVPHVMLFALADIAAYEELAYDYNYRVDGVRDEDGELRRKYCYCGTFRCSGRMY
ncbi:Histone-lysine N-methyltransferase, H3 lysine-9 specific SUVH5 [Acorus calamus]|uniref:Histone-lysine N-methyltransferase, H3 lysine-9 specific SUVH5 n=1 Tax=Acorus calamus TaxID=4465 RepID=A0AAV9CUL4_ACOCL|nr:Histone-lysine N-methyltransferase, H3 lysine-9 specific SUVH5 [Acorus calamus]